MDERVVDKVELPDEVCVVVCEDVTEEVAELVPVVVSDVDCVEEIVLESVDETVVVSDVDTDEVAVEVRDVDNVEVSEDVAVVVTVVTSQTAKLPTSRAAIILFKAVAVSSQFESSKRNPPRSQRTPLLEVQSVAFTTGPSDAIIIVLKAAAVSWQSVRFWLPDNTENPRDGMR